MDVQFARKGNLLFFPIRLSPVDRADEAML